jgi:5-methylcytosine-specific restriction endonuclease McrA
LNLLERSKTATAAVGTTDPEGAASRARRLDTLAVAASVARSRPMSQPAIVAPLSLDSYRVQFTVPRQTYEKLRRVQDLLRHQIPNGNLAAIFDRALTLLLRETEKKKIGLASGRDRSSPPTARKSSREHSRSGPPGRSRRIPAGVRREVWRRDGGQCAFVSESGRCSETGFLEFHHVLPFASGGAATVENIQLRCRSHNSHEAQEYFGRVQNAAEVSDEVSAALRDGPTVVDGRAEYLELGPDRVQPEPQKAPEKAQTDAGGFETAASERGSPPVRAE